MIVELLPADVHNERTISQGHPPNWQNPRGGRDSSYGGRYLARLGELQVLEGSWNPNLIVVVEFPSLEQARAWYRSPEYAFALELRDTALRRNLILIDGLNQPATGEYGNGV